MFVSPKTLKAFCFQQLRQQLEALKDNLVLNGELVEELLESLSIRHELSDQTLLHPIFSALTTKLTRVRIVDASLLSLKGLRVLRAHPIQELEVKGLECATVNELIGCLGESALNSLRALNVSNSVFALNNQFVILVGLTKLRALQVLDVSHTDFNAHGLDIVVEDLPLLRALNISETKVKDISPLKKCRERLRSLSIYNLTGQHFFQVLQQLNLLVHLDVSSDKDLNLFFKTSNQWTEDLLRHPECFPHLKSLDISGRDNIDALDLESFLLFNRSIEFLGLMQTSIAFDQQILSLRQWYDPEIVVSGNGSEEQIKESLKRYQSRPQFLQKSLFHLYNYTLTYCEPRSDLIQLIVAVMRRHVKVIAICMAATACLYNLTKNEFGDRIHPKTLRSVVEVTLLGMKTFPTHQQLQKNALLTLCSDRILQNVSFDRFLCTRLVLDSLVNFKDTTLNRMAVAICSILAAKISTQDTSHLGAKPKYMEALLEIVRQRVTSTMDNDIMLKFTLSALWNLTDESPKTCQMFLQKDGMDLYLRVLKEFEGESSVETKVLGLLNNIAEVHTLRPNLMSHQFLQVLRDLMKSAEIDVSYFAAGIFAHLLSSDGIHWKNSSLDLSLLLDELVRVVLSWKTPETEMVAYRSFLPFLPLLNCFESPAVQLWAIWAIHHVCSKNPKRYCEMLVQEEGVESIAQIIKRPANGKDRELREYCEQTLDVIRHEFPNLFVDCF